MRKGTPCKDHLDNSFVSESAMCRHYHIELMTYRERIKLNWSTEKALMTPPTRRTRVPCEDFKGTAYTSKSMMCKKYGINPRTYNERIKSGYTKEDALTKELFVHSKGPFYDFKGNKYKYFSDMCKAYNKRCECVRQRLRQGMTLEDALTKPLRGEKL